MHVLNPSQNLTRGMTKGSRLLVRSPTPPLPSRRSRRRNLKIPRRSTSSTPRCVGKVFPAIVHCQQQEPKEPHFGIGHEAVGLTDHNTSTTLHHRVASPRTGFVREPTMSPSIQHQAPSRMRYYVTFLPLMFVMYY